MTERLLVTQIQWNFKKPDFLSLETHLERIWFSYPFYSELPRRDAWVIGGGLNASF